jgi:hypothetical protein
MCGYVTCVPECRGSVCCASQLGAYFAVLFFISGSTKYMFRIIRVSHLSVYPLRTVTPDNRAYTVFLTFTMLKNISIYNVYNICASNNHIRIVKL